MAKLPTRNTCLQKHFYSHQEAMNPRIYRETGDLKFHSGDMASSTAPMADMDSLRTEVKLLWLKSLQIQNNYLRDGVNQIHKIRDVDSRQYNDTVEHLVSVSNVKWALRLQLRDNLGLSIEHWHNGSSNNDFMGTEHVLNSCMTQVKWIGSYVSPSYQSRKEGRPPIRRTKNLLEVKLHSHMFPTSSAP